MDPQPSVTGPGFMSVTIGSTDLEKLSNGARICEWLHLILMEPKNENCSLTGPLFESSTVYWEQSFGIVHYNRPRH